MIKIKHPLEKCNQEQEIFIAACNEKDRRYPELIFSHGNASYRYHTLASEYSPTMEDFKE